MPKASIIIPCYNQGYWLNDAVDSALTQDYDDYDIILINDGSTDPVSNRVFEQIEHSRIQKISTGNKGLAEARNTAIRASDATFILPLDSDDRISPYFLSKAVPILEAKTNIGIVYSDIELFGEQQGVWKLEPYSFPEVLINPQIVASALYRKSEWEKAGGYKSDMIYGWEDYDFWLSLIETGLDVHRIPEVLFYYRRSEGSMAGLDRKKMLFSFKKLFEHHKELYEKNIEILFDAVIESKPYRERIASKEAFEIYIPGKDGYTSRNIREQHYPKGVWSRINFQILEPCESNTHRLRLDPGESIGIYDIASIKVFNAIDQNLLFQAKDVGSFSQITLAGSAVRVEHNNLLRILNTGSDPYFYLPDLSKCIQDYPIQVEIWIRFQADVSELAEDSKFICESNEQMVKIRDLEENNRFYREQEQLLKYQEISLREELQNHRNERTLLQAEIKNQNAITKSIQAEMHSLQSEYKQLIQNRDHLLEKISTLESAKSQCDENQTKEKKKRWF